ncbi:hypothetical protein [Flagellimonas baculiformis]|uniref:hypothetical protein n=1 Tax=Flagellimonas baculiformis TaxID=3067310 RepID=UPI00296F98E0|nr:hypothetical protein [Muricauda sp. D6]
MKAVEMAVTGELYLCEKDYIDPPKNGGLNKKKCIPDELWRLVKLIKKVAYI